MGFQIFKAILNILCYSECINFNIKMHSYDSLCLCTFTNIYWMFYYLLDAVFGISFNVL